MRKWPPSRRTLARPGRRPTRGGRGCPARSSGSWTGCGPPCRRRQERGPGHGTSRSALVVRPPAPGPVPGARPPPLSLRVPAAPGPKRARPAAMEKAPASSPAIPASRTVATSVEDAPATPRTNDKFVNRPSPAPKTAARWVPPLTSRWRLPLGFRAPSTTRAPFRPRVAPPARAIT